MAKLRDKIVLGLIMIMFLYKEQSAELSVIVLLVSLLFSMLIQYFSDRKFRVAPAWVYVLLCFVEPVFCLGLSLVLYEVFENKEYYIAGAGGLAVLINLTTLSYSEMFMIVASVLIAAIIGSRTRRLEAVEKKLIETRDNSEELNMLLKEKNKRLTESQDYEIYLATLKERNRIAREIHDNVGHMLTRSILQTGALIAVSSDEIQKEGLKSVNETLNSAMTSIRNSVHDLHDESLDLRASIEEAARKIAENFDVTLKLEFSDNIPPAVKLGFIGVVKESLTNAVKHSNGDRILVSVQEHPAFYQLSVEDNGSGGKVGDGGIGLSNMRDRISGLGGIIRFSAESGGFRVFATVPKNKG